MPKGYGSEEEETNLADSANYSEIKSEDISDLKQNLQDSFDISHIDLTKLTSAERNEEIQRC